MPTGRCSVMLAPRSYTVLALGSPVCRPCKLGRIPLFASLQCLGPVERIACCKHQQMTAAHTHASHTHTCKSPRTHMQVTPRDTIRVKSLRDLAIQLLLLARARCVCVRLPASQSFFGPLADLVSCQHQSIKAPKYQLARSSNRLFTCCAASVALLVLHC